MDVLEPFRGTALAADTSRQALLLGHLVAALELLTPPPGEPLPAAIALYADILRTTVTGLLKGLEGATELPAPLDLAGLHMSREAISATVGDLTRRVNEGEEALRESERKREEQAKAPDVVAAQAELEFLWRCVRAYCERALADMEQHAKRPQPDVAGADGGHGDPSANGTAASNGRPATTATGLLARLRLIEARFPALVPNEGQ